MKEVNPQKLFENYASHGHRMFKDFSISESQEMISQFANSWNTIMTRAMESPDEWFNTLTGFYQDQFKLWLNLFNPSAEPVVEAAPGDRRFSAGECDQRELHTYPTRRYLLRATRLSDIVFFSILADAATAK